MKDPLKQGLKQASFRDVFGAERLFVEVKDPLKQGLKLLFFYIVNGHIIG